MNKHKRLLYLAGVVLTCNLALAGCQKKPFETTPEEPTKHKTTTKANKHHRSTKASKRKAVVGIDKPTDDGFLLENESQIESRTESGIIVKHGDHKHFFFYSDLKGTKWAYLIPKNYDETKEPTHSMISQSGSHFSNGEDGYVFNPNDIVAEDDLGYTVRHGDHYHYILKSSVGVITKGQASLSRPAFPALAPLNHYKNGTPGIDKPTSDGFLFDGKNIKGSTNNGILVDHQGHLHLISFEDLQNSKWSHLVNQYKSSSKSELKDLKEDVDFQEKLDYLAKELKVNSTKIKKVIVDGKIGLEYPHEDHTHVVFLSDLDIHKPFVSPEQHILRDEKGETFEQRKERLIKEYMEHFKVDRDNITVDGNYMSVRHGDHSHIYKIDPKLPDDPERDVRTETTNLDIEKQSVFGPFYTEGSQETLTRNGVYQKYNVSGIKNIKNFILLKFSTNSQYGNLEVDGKKAKRVYYLVRKDTNWEDLHINHPVAKELDGRLFKGWKTNMPTSGKMSRTHQSFYADFDLVRKKPTKNVYGPEDDISDLDLTGYTSIKYTTLSNGRLQLKNVVQGGFVYYVKTDLTWKEAKEQGLIIPTPVPNPNYEFIDFRDTNLGGKGENDKISMTISIAAFGTTAPYIGPYIAKNPNNPTDIHDPSRHPNYYWHNPLNYVAVAFKADENGELISRAGRGKTAVYLIRKGYSLEKAGIFPPVAQGNPGYYADSVSTVLSTYKTPITSDIVYTISFKNNNDKQNVSSQQMSTENSMSQSNDTLLGAVSENSESHSDEGLLGTLPNKESQVLPQEVGDLESQITEENVDSQESTARRLSEEKKTLEDDYKNLIPE